MKARGGGNQEARGGGGGGRGWTKGLTCKEEKAPLAPHAEGKVADRRGFLSRDNPSSKEKLGVQAHSTGSVPVKLLSERVLQQRRMW